MEMRHPKYRITSDPGHITIRLMPLGSIAKFYKFNDHVTIGFDETMDTVQIELRFKPGEEVKKRKPIELILKHKIGRNGNEDIPSGGTVRKRHSGL